MLEEYFSHIFAETKSRFMSHMTFRYAESKICHAKTCHCVLHAIIIKNDTNCSRGTRDSGDGNRYLSTPGRPTYLGDLCACRRDTEDGLFYFIFRVLSRLSFLLLILFFLTPSYRIGRSSTTILLSGS